MGDRLRRLAGARQTVTGLSLVVILAACGGTTSSPGPAASQPPTAGMKPPTSIGAGEGQLNLGGLHRERLGSALPAANGMRGQRQVRGLVR